MMNFPFQKGWLYLTTCLLRPVGRRELLDGDVSDIVDLETFECQSFHYQSVSYLAI
jgi:hypothetical protein